MSKNKKDKSTRYNFSWWMKNVLVAVAVGLLCPLLLKTNFGYQWFIDGYTKTNRQTIKEIKDYSYHDRMMARLGYDFAFIDMIKANTPENAVVFYPSREDFIDTVGTNANIPFTGNLCDKLSAVRFLYPRHIVTKEELGKTSWSKKITHVAIVNGHGRELLPYEVSKYLLYGVLPTDSAKAQQQLKQN